jgi:acyl-coenzyme A thioesterase PaaI-like protein
MSDAQNAFQGFHVRQVPMTPEEEEKAAIAQTMREDIAQLVSVESVSFLDRSPIIGAINPLAAPMHVETITADDGSAVVVGTVTFTKQYEGAPACVHGGFIAAYFDEVLGVAQSTTGNPGMTVNLSVDYRSPTPINKPLVFNGWVERVERRKIFTVGTLHHGETLCAEAHAIFVSMSPELMARISNNAGPTR